MSGYQVPFFIVISITIQASIAEHCPKTGSRGPCRQSSIPYLSFSIPHSVEAFSSCPLLPLQCRPESPRPPHTVLCKLANTPLVHFYLLILYILVCVL